MKDLILQIAMLCQIHSGSSAEYIASVQLDCQKQYAACYLEKSKQPGYRNSDVALLECMADQKR